MMQTRTGLVPACLAALLLGTPFAVGAKVSQSEADRLGQDLMPLGGLKAGNEDGSIPEWDGGMQGFEVELDGTERHVETYEEYGSLDEPLYVITADNLDEYADLVTPGHKALFKKYPDTFKMPVYPSRRTAFAPEFVYEATKENAVKAELANEGESLLNAAVGIPFPIPGHAKEVMWNHKVRYRSQAITRYNTQLAVQGNGSFTPFKLREDVLFNYSRRGVQPDELDNVIIYFLQVVLAPPRQAGQVLLVHETMDQVKEPRRAWLYNPGQRRVRRAPNVAYDNPGTGADGLRTNDQLDMFNGATDRYNWKIVGKKEMLVPYNAYQLSDSRLTYEDMTMVGHLNPENLRYEKHRVWVIDSNVREGTSHIYQRRTFYVDEDSWTALLADIYDKRDALWRVQEFHLVAVPWIDAVGGAGGTVHDLQSGRYLVLEVANEEPTPVEVELSLDKFRTNNMKREAQQLR